MSLFSANLSAEVSQVVVKTEWTSVEYWQEIYWANRGCSNYSTYLRPQQTSTRFPLFFYRRYSPKSGIPWLCLLGVETSRKRTYIIRYLRVSRSDSFETVSFISWIFTWGMRASHSRLPENVFVVVLQCKVRFSFKLKSKNIVFLKLLNREFFFARYL